MKTADVLAFFSNDRNALAKVLRIKRPSTYWGDTVPELRQWQLEWATSGQLRVDEALRPVALDHKPAYVSPEPPLQAPANTPEPPLRLPKRWWEDNTQTECVGALLGLPAHPGESWQIYKTRLLAAIDKRKKGE